MSIVGDLRAGLRENIKANVDGWQVSRYRLAAPTPPGIQIVRGEIRWHRAMQDGLREYDFRVQAFVANTTDIGTQAPLDDLHDVMVDAIESDKTLGGVADDLIVLQPIPEEQILVRADNTAVVISEWLVTVLVNGSI